MCQFIMSRGYLLCAISVVVLAIELGLPFVILLSMWSSVKVVFIACMVLLHIGIFLVFSTLVGVLFLPNVATYVLAMQANFCVGSWEWLIAFLIATLPVVVVVVTGRLMPEVWPLS